MIGLEKLAHFCNYFRCRTFRLWVLLVEDVRHVRCCVPRTMYIVKPVIPKTGITAKPQPKYLIPHRSLFSCVARCFIYVNLEVFYPIDINCAAIQASTTILLLREAPDGPWLLRYYGVLLDD